MKKNIFAAIILAVSILFTFSSCSNAANSSANACTITLDANGGKVYPSSMTVFSGTPVSYLPKAVREGFEFSNWNTQKNGKGSIIQTGTIIESDITLYAQWGTKLVSVEYYPNYPDGSKGKKQTVSFASGNQILITDTPFSHKGYSFIGWNTKEDGSGDDWSPNTYYFDTENLKLYAQWEAEFGYIYKVHHYQQNTDGTYPEEPTTTTTNYGYTDQIYSATRKNYTGFIMPEPKYVTVKADNSAYVDYYYERKTVTLTFDPNGGTFPQEYTLNSDGLYKITGLYGSAFNIPFTSKDGYDYSWNPSISSPYMPASNATYTANWTLRTYTISYNLNGGNFNTGFTPVTEFTELENITLPTGSNITKAGYSFTGWYEDSAFKGKRIYSWLHGQQKENITLYAKWEEVSNTWGGMSDYDTSWYNKTSKSFVLDRPEQFAGMAQLINSGTNFDGQTVELNLDIILNEDHLNYQNWGTNPPSNTWTGIGYDGKSFKGVFDGKGHSIYGLYIDTSTIKSRHVGFIGDTDSAVIKNINITNCFVKSNVSRSAILIGWADNGTVVENCTVSGKVESSHVLVSGIVGHCAGNVTIKDCINYADLYSSYNEALESASYVAGITADAFYSGNKIINCINYGNIYGVSNIAGGIFGTAGSGSSGIFISGCKNYGNVQSGGYGAGGIAAYNRGSDKMTIINCTNYGNVTAGSYGAGGILGYISSTGGTEIYNSDNQGTVKANSYAGGIVGEVSSKASIYNSVNTGKVSLTSTGTSFGGIEGGRTSNASSTNTCYCYTLISSDTVSKAFGNTTYGNITGCGTFNSYLSPVSLMYDVAGGTQGTTITTTYANNSSDLTFKVLNNYASDKASITYNKVVYELRSWKPGENGRPQMQY